MSHEMPLLYTFARVGAVRVEVLFQVASPSPPAGDRLFGPARVAYRVIDPDLTSKTADRFPPISSASSGRTNR